MMSESSPASLSATGAPPLKGSADGSMTDGANPPPIIICIICIMAIMGLPCAIPGIPGIPGIAAAPGIPGIWGIPVG